MQAMTSYASVFLQKFRDKAARFRGKPWHAMLTAALMGAGLSAAAVGNRAVPLSLGLLCATTPGLSALAAALGGSLGYWLFWREAQGLVWMAAGLAAVLLAGNTRTARQQPLLLPALAAVVVSGTGLAFLLLARQGVPVGLYLLRVCLSAGATACFRAWRQTPKGAAGWLGVGLITFALAQLVPVRGLGLGYVAAGFACVRGTLPGAAMAGLALDLARVTRVPMTGAVCLGFLVGRLSRGPKWLPVLACGASYGLVSGLCGRFDLMPLPGLLLGSGLGSAFCALRATREVSPPPRATSVQTRLARAAGAMEGMERMLLLAREPEIDLEGLLRQALSESCDGCPARRGCKGKAQGESLSPDVLEREVLQPGDLPAGCKKQSRLLHQLRREQGHLRAIKADRNRQQAYQRAVANQYRFLSGYLRELEQGLGAQKRVYPLRFRPEIGVSARALGEVSGDRWARFSPEEGVCMLLLCDGMGTGPEAADDAREAIGLLGQLLEAGISPGQALESFHSLSALCSTTGSATVDLVQLDLRTGTAVCYQWGTASGYLLRAGQIQKIGTAEPPPAISQQARFGEEGLSLSGGEALILLSDGVGAEGLAQPQWTAPGMGAGEMAASILEHGARREDDATVMVIRLVPLDPSTA